MLGSACVTSIHLGILITYQWDISFLRHFIIHTGFNSLWKLSYNLTSYHTNAINISLWICFAYICIAFTFNFKESTIVAVQFRAIISNALNPVTMTGSTRRDCWAAFHKNCKIELIWSTVQRGECCKCHISLIKPFFNFLNINSIFLSLKCMSFVLLMLYGLSMSVWIQVK